MKALTTKQNNRQQGATTLIIAIMLLIVMAIISATSSRTSFMEQNIVGNDIRAREAQEAAEAGLEYGVAWATENTLSISNMDCPPPPGIISDFGCTLICPPTVPPATNCPGYTQVEGSTSSEAYDYTLKFERNISSEAIKITSVANGFNDSTIEAQANTVIKQDHIELFDDAVTSSPPPIVIAGCMTNAPTGGPDIYLIETATPSIMTGQLVTNAALDACLPQGTGAAGFDADSWSDDNSNHVMEASEEGGNISFERNTFSCPGGIGTHCVWDEFFNMTFTEAKALVYNADGATNETVSNSHIFDKNNLIACGEQPNNPSMIILRDRGPITTSSITGSCSGVGVDNKTIGLPDKPVIIIVPGDDSDLIEIAQDTSAVLGDTPGNYVCPSIAAGITIYGIIYFESDTCAAHGWGGATLYGSLLTEGDYDKPNSNSRFIEVDHDGESRNPLFNAGVDYATRMPGTWSDFE